ncbi:MAG: hypothetical protein U0269_11620 [Polyangiales bacterium]
MKPLSTRAVIAVIALSSVSLCGVLAACSSNHASSSATTSSTTTSAGAEAPTNSGESDAGAERPRSGMSVHVANVRIGGPLPRGTDVATDALDVQFDLEIQHFGAQDLADVRVRDARVALSSGFAIDFDPVSEAFDGRIAAGATRQIPFHKRANSASPRATHELCGQWMRVELSVALGDTGRTSRVTSRQVRVQCPDE